MPQVYLSPMGGRPPAVLRPGRRRAPTASADGALRRIGSDGAAAATTHGRVDEQRDDRADDRADDAGGLEEAVLDVLAEQQRAEEAADEGADDPEQDGGTDAHVLPTGDDRPS